MTNKSCPTVSVIVPTYQREKELKRALSSLASQSYQNFEIILVDDNSDREWTERVEKIVKNFKKNYKEISLVYIKNKENMGSAITRNIGIKNSEGTYITFLDDDDIYLKDKLKNQVEFMLDGKYDFSITDLYLYFNNEKLMEKRIRSYIKEYDSNKLFEYHLKYHMTGTDTFMFKKSYIEEIGMFAPIDIGDEFYLMQRAIEASGKFGYLNKCDIKAYVHINEKGLSSGQKKIDAENKLYSHKKQYFERIDEDTRNFIKMRHYAVIAFAEIRMNRKKNFFVNAVKSFFSAPISCIKFLISMRW
ncbi:glycosyltransferase family 2 protein [Globicatella sanguinis]